MVSEGQAFSLALHWKSCTSVSCYFSQDQFADKFLVFFPFLCDHPHRPDGPVRMVRGCHHRRGDRREHTLAPAGQQVLLMCEIAQEGPF